jgi:hypothetical protein
MLGAAFVNIPVNKVSGNVELRRQGNL